jgi:putative NADH-flavin reductase
MKILVLGATGRTGNYIVKEAIDLGMEVNALVRNSSRLLTRHNKLKFFEGSPYLKEDLHKPVEGVDAVISALNVSRKSDFPWSKLVSPADLMSKSIRNTVEVMKEKGVKRIIVISAAGAGDSWENTPGWFRWIINNSNIRYAYADHNKQEELLAGSGLDWTAVRPTGLSGKNSDKDIVITKQDGPKPGFMITRHAVATFILDILKDPNYYGKAPIVSQK